VTTRPQTTDYTDYRPQSFYPLPPIPYTLSSLGAMRLAPCDIRFTIGFLIQSFLPEDFGKFLKGCFFSTLVCENNPPKGMNGLNHSKQKTVYQYSTPIRNKLAGHRSAWPAKVDTFRDMARLTLSAPIVKLMGNHSGSLRLLLKRPFCTLLVERISDRGQLA